MIKGVPRFVSHDVPEERHTEQGEITNTVEYLMTDKLVLIPEPLLVQDSVLVEHHGVFQGTPSSKSILFQIIDFMQEPKGSGATDLLFKKAIIQCNGV
jgi:hypothetical protein